MHAGAPQADLLDDDGLCVDEVADEPDSRQAVEQPAELDPRVGRTPGHWQVPRDHADEVGQAEQRDRDAEHLRLRARGHCFAVDRALGRADQRDVRVVVSDGQVGRKTDPDRRQQQSRQEKPMPEHRTVLFDDDGRP